MRRGLLLAGLAILVVGCDSLRGPHQEIVAPSVEGRVLDAETHQPVGGARVHRVVGGTVEVKPAERHGGEILQDSPPAVTASDGGFRLGAVRGGYLLFERTPPLLVTLRVEHSRYRTFLTNVDLVKVPPAQTSNGPVVLVGDLLLTPGSP